MTREQKIRIMMEYLDERAVSIPAYLEEDYQRAINAAFQKIEKLEIREGVRLDKKKTDPTPAVTPKWTRIKKNTPLE